MECPYCSEEMTCTDYYGLGIPGTPEFKKIGDIFTCDNEQCQHVEENGGGHADFYTDENGELHDGYPC